MRIAQRAFMFAAVALLVSVAFDALLWGGYQGGEPASQRQWLAVVHAAVHVGVFFSALVASAVVFAALKSRRLSSQHAAVSGLVYGMVGIVGAVAVFPVFGVAGFAAVLLLLAFVIAAGGALFFGKVGG
jgi:hypothetical protein